jgi:hypothetical protein
MPDAALRTAVGKLGAGRDAPPVALADGSGRVVWRRAGYLYLREGQVDDKIQEARRRGELLARSE